MNTTTVYLDARCDDATGRTVEVGIFDAETDECRQLIPITAANARELLVSLECALNRQAEAYKPKQESLI